MSILQPPEYRSILEKISSWPAPQRLMLARQILQGLEGETRLGAKRPGGLSDLLGLLQTEASAPTDEECRRALEEELLGKYGR